MLNGRQTLLGEQTLGLPCPLNSNSISQGSQAPRAKIVRAIPRPTTCWLRDVGSRNRPTSCRSSGCIAASHRFSKSPGSFGETAANQTSRDCKAHLISEVKSLVSDLNGIGRGSTAPWSRVGLNGETSACDLAWRSTSTGLAHLVAFGL